MSKTKSHRFRVFVEQVNQTFVDVRATTAEGAAEKGLRKWRKEEAHSRVCSVERLDFKP